MYKRNQRIIFKNESVKNGWKSVRKLGKVLYFGLHAEKDWLQDAMEAKMDKERFHEPLSMIHKLLVIINDT